MAENTAPRVRSPLARRALALAPDRSAIVLGAVFLAIIAGIYVFTARQGSRILETAALEDARIVNDALREFRTVYTAEVVERARARGMVVTHAYKDDPNAIPLPATLTIELGSRMGSAPSGTPESRLYSPFPFPWREAENHRIFEDPFSRDAWEAVTADPEAPFHRFETYRGRDVLRYATADRMRSQCLDCHNSHPQTPRRGWKEGDVRGVLEVILPMDTVLHEYREILRRRLLLIAGLSVPFLLALWVVFGRWRRRSRELRDSLRKLAATQTELVHAAKLAGLGQLGAGIAHELAQPLTGIRGFAEALDRRLVGEDARYAQKILDQSGRMSRILDHLREFARPSSAQVGSVPVSRPIEDALLLVGQQLRLHRIAVHVEIPNPPPLVRANSQELEQVFLNLLTNAMDAFDSVPTSGAWAITILAREISSTRQVEVLLSDNGPGIPASIRGRIFDPFFTTKPPGKGTGLGLSISHRIVVDLGGELSLLASDGPGATFRMLIPAESGE